jgi:hypothetical protein
VDLSRSKVDRAGARIRKTDREGGSPLSEDLAVVESFKSTYLPTLGLLQDLLIAQLMRVGTGLPPDTHRLTSSLL